MNFDNRISEKSRGYFIVIKPLNFINRLLFRFKMKLELVPVLNQATDMVSLYQKINFFHLLNQVVLNEVPGDVVELGCYEGQTAVLFQTILNKAGSDKQLILYDNFKNQIGLTGSIRTRLHENFSKHGFKMPQVIEGDFKVTLPGKLPDAISFLHIDCGFGGDPLNHKKVVLHCLQSAYERMPQGAVGMLMDYYDISITVDGTNSNPGVKLACDEFFADKPEKVYTLYGGEYSHGYFVKGLQQKA